MLAGSENPYVTFHTDNFGPPRSSRCQPEQIKCSISIKGVNEIAPPSAFTLMNTIRRETLEKVYSVPHLNGYAHSICLYSCHFIPCYKLSEAHFTVSGNKMTITNKILTNQRSPYK